MREHRAIVAAIVAAFALVGIAAGIRMAEIQTAGRAQSATPPVSSEASSSQPFEKSADRLHTDGQYLSTKSATTTTKKAPLSSTPATVQPVDAVTAEAYIVGDLETGTIYAEKDADTSLPVASISKLVTALVATDIYSATTTISIEPEELQAVINQGVGPEQAGLVPGERFTLDELMHALLMDSSNLAGEAIASSTDRAHFLNLMSQYLWEIGMPTSFAADPTGLSRDNSGTARGIFGLTEYLYRHRPDILAITTISTYSIATTTQHMAHTFVNIHPFAGDPLFLGGKTGHTNAAQDTMLTIMDIGGHPIAFIVLRSTSGERARDTGILIEDLKL